MKADSTMGASSGNTRGGPVFCFVSSFLQLHPICQSVTTNRKQASNLCTYNIIRTIHPRTHARTHIRADSTHTISYCTTQHHSLFFPHHLDLCSALSSPLSFHFFSFLSFCLLTPTMIASLNFSVLFLLSPICSSLLSFLNLSSLRPPTLFHSSLSFFSLASPPFAQMRDDSQQSGNLGNYAAVSE